MKTLHILNGDSTAFIFKQTGIEGDLLIWRELLSEGPVSTTNLWTLRLPWMIENFGATVANYQEMVMDEASKMEDLSAYECVYLWFEFDLVCQINLIYLLTILSRKQSIFLICPDRFKGLPNFKGLGELNPVQLTSLISSKTKLEAKDLAFATKAWHLYVENDYAKITAFLTSDFGNLSLLKPALQAHLLRFPGDNGLNYIEELLFSLLKSGISDKEELYNKFWETATIFGMGNSQIDYYLKELDAKRKE